MIPDRRVRRGDVLRLLGPCGGGYGPPHEREPTAVARDVADGLVSTETARERYGVAVAPDGTLDAAATATLRGSR